jgi:hypothetical protein
MARIHDKHVFLSTQDFVPVFSYFLALIGCMPSAFDRYALPTFHDFKQMEQCNGKHLDLKCELRSERLQHTARRTQSKIFHLHVHLSSAHLPHVDGTRPTKKKRRAKSEYTGQAPSRALTKVGAGIWFDGLPTLTRVDAINL